MSDPTESTPGQNPFTKPGFIISAALVIALIAAVIVILALPRPETAPNVSQTTPATASPASGAPSQSASGSESVCGLKPSPELALGTAPRTEWALVGRIAAPNDPQTSGPGIKEPDGFRYCYAQSPTGALYAAANLLAMTSSGNPELTSKVTDKLLVPGPGRDAAIKDAATPAASSGDGISVQFRGFILKSYSPTRANVDIAIEASNGVLGHAVLPLEWTDGDWKLVVSDSGKMVNDFSQLSDLNSFIAWSGV